MKTQDLWKQYQGYTRDLTEHARKLGFAGAVICWLFKTDSFTFPSLIYGALGCFVVYFICDILHFLLGAILTRHHAQKEEFRLLQETGSIDGEIKKPRWLDWPAYGLFLMKSVALILGFVFIGCELVVRLRMEPAPLTG